MGMLLSYHDGYRPEADRPEDKPDPPRKPRAKAKATKAEAAQD